MKSLFSKRLSESVVWFDVAAQVPHRHRFAVSRHVIPSVLGNESSHQRVLRPRIAQNGRIPAGTPEETPEATAQDDPNIGSDDMQPAGVQNVRGRTPRGDGWGGDDDSRGRGLSRDRTQKTHDVEDDQEPRNRLRGYSREHSSTSNRKSRNRPQSSAWQSLDRPPPPPPQQPLPVDRRMARSPRYLAVQQLIRVEQEGAYVGLVNGSPTARQSRRGGGGGGGEGLRGGAPEEGLDDEEEDAGEREDGAGDALRRGRGRERERERAARQPPLDPRDQRLVKELVAGVTRLRRRLDYIVSSLSQQTPADMDPGVRQVLRLGVFELTERHLAPHALNEHVQLVKAVAGPGAGPFVNGVLRSAARLLAAGSLPTPELRALSGERGSSGSSSGSMSGSNGGSSGGSSGREVLRQLALQHSHPNWMVSRWLGRFGREATEELLRRNNQPPVYTVRVNTLRPGASAARLLAQLAAVGVTAEPSPLLPEEFIRVRSGLQKLLAEGFVADGSLFVQDESAGLVVSLLDPQPGEKLLDCCAAPGGKTLFAADRMKGRGSITALDVSAARLGALRRAAELAGVGDMVATHAVDLRSWARQAADRAAWQEEMRPLDRAAEAAQRQLSAGELEWERTGSSRDRIRQPSTALLYDKVLLDAPCTGTGVLAKRADLRWRRALDQLHGLVALQDELLDAAAGLVAPGGVLVYSTCSIEEEEDQQRVASFLDRHPEFELEPAGCPGAEETALGRPGRHLPPAVLTAEGFVAPLPHVHDTDGAFAARLRRREVRAL